MQSADSNVIHNSSTARLLCYSGVFYPYVNHNDGCQLNHFRGEIPVDRLFMPNGRERDHRSLHWVLAIERLIAFLFIDTLLSSLEFNDDGTCQTYTTQSTCESNRKLDQLSNLCQWNAVRWGCSFNETQLCLHFTGC